MVGDAGEDPQILSGARARAETWLRERRGVDPEVVGTALHLAATRGDQALFDALHGAARAEKDRRARQQLLGALGSFRDPALVKQAFAIALSDEFPIRETIPLVMGATKSPVTRTIAYDFVRSNFDALAARLPVGLRYAGVAALGGKLYVAGGVTTSGTSSAVVCVRPAHARGDAGGDAACAGCARAARRARGRALPRRRRRQGRLLRIDANGAVSVAARLPQPLANAAAVARGGSIYVLGGDGWNAVYRLTLR